MLSRAITRILTTVIALCLAHLVQAAPDLNAEPVTRFQRTVQYLQGESPELRSDFAATALYRLANAYSTEAQLARARARKAGGGSNLWSWSVTVEGYASQLNLLLADIELGFPVSFTLGDETSLAIAVADRTVILSHPRLNEQGAFEQEVLRDFCARHRCEEYSQRDTSVEPIPLLSTRIRAQWTFDARETLCAYQGLTVRFDSTRDMAHARLICEQLLQEVVTLAEELTWQQRHAVPIEWGQLAIQPTPQRPEHMVQLNTPGDTVLVTLPMLYRSEQLFKQVLPWIRQRVDRQAEVNVVLDADQYGWQMP